MRDYIQPNRVNLNGIYYDLGSERKQEFSQMIEMKHVNFFYDIRDSQYEEQSNNSKGCLKDINLTIDAGEVVILTGPSGGGKTTVLRLLNGLIPSYYQGEIEGSIKINKTSVSELSLGEISKMVGTVFQDPRAQFFSVDTTSELAFGCENQGLPKEEIYRRIDLTVERFNMEKLMDRDIFALSGGEKQKIACASIDVENPSVILLDEPSANLDTRATMELKRMISRWKEMGKTIVISEHRLSYVWDLADRMIILKEGKIADEIDRMSMDRLTETDLYKMGLRSKEMENPLTISIDKETGNKNEKFLYLKKFYCKRGGKQILSIDEMKIPEGKVTAIVGENGVGKSTLLRCLCGFEKSCRGNIVFRGKTYDKKAIRNLTYMVMQDVNHQLFTESISEEMRISDPYEDEEKEKLILGKLNLLEMADRHPMSLSGGQKQRVAIACAVASNRDILLFDEPTSGLDYGHMRGTADLFRMLCDMGKSIIVVTHDSELIRNCCDAVVHMKRNAGVNNAV